MKLNIGSHNKRVDGYTNVDILDLPNVDIKHDLTILPWPFEDNSVERILSEQFLEHLPVKSALPTLKEFRRILQPGGELELWVPDIGAICKMIDKQCSCVPRKVEDFSEYKANPECQGCFGTGMIHPQRWHVAFTGSQKHRYDYHLNHFTHGYMDQLLDAAGFSEWDYEDNIYNIIVKAIK